LRLLRPVFFLLLSTASQCNDRRKNHGKLYPMISSAPKYSRITGTGSYLPPHKLTNADLAARLAKDGIETSSEWIVERTGIHARHFAAPEVAASDLALPACVAALEAAGKSASDVDLIIVATSTPDMVFPSTAAILQHKLAQYEEKNKPSPHASKQEFAINSGVTSDAPSPVKSIAGCPAFDVQAVCSGFVYALTVADSMIKTGAAKCALVVGSEVFSRILDFKDRTTCVLFGDGAGVVVLEASNEPGILATELHADGKHVGVLCVPGNVSGGQILGDPTLKMDGQAVFKLAVGVLADVARSVLAKAGKTEADIDWLIPHQANIRIMLGTAKKLKMSEDKVIVTVDQHGNTSAASIPLAMDVAVRSGKIKKGDTVMLEGVGGGFTWGAVLLNL
jgi:3-oxoacyl-[acyl-carrier-protein] synthase III